MGIFGDLFDFNNDGKIDAFEKAAEFGAFSGDILDRISISNFANAPRAGFNKIKKMIE